MFFPLTYVNDFAKGPPTLQQSLARALGSLAYDIHEHTVHTALACLLGGVDKAVCMCFSWIRAAMLTSISQIHFLQMWKPAVTVF